jgi:hypothetical protein
VNCVVALAYGTIQGMLVIVTPLFEPCTKPLKEPHDGDDPIAQPYRLLLLDVVHSGHDIVFVCLVQGPKSGMPRSGLEPGPARHRRYRIEFAPFTDPEIRVGGTVVDLSLANDLSAGVLKRP